jgi:hypothetical protein
MREAIEPVNLSGQHEVSQTVSQEAQAPGDDY